MSNFERAEEIAQSLRLEPYVLFKNDCIRKSQRLKRACSKIGIHARVVVCLGYARAKILGRHIIIPVIHGWGEVDGRRIETSRPLGHTGWLGIIPVKIKPLISLHF